MNYKRIKFVFLALVLLVFLPNLGITDGPGSRLKKLTFQPGPQVQLGDLIVDGENITVEGGEYGTILVKNDGKLTINGDTWANEVVLRWGQMTVNGSLNVAENVTMEQNAGDSILTVNGNLAVVDTITIEENGEPNVLTVYGSNNSARQIHVYGGTFYLSGTWTVEDMWIHDGAKAKIIAQNSWPDSGKFILYCDQITIEEGGAIDGDGAGNDPRGEGGDWYRDAAGGGHGGRGGRGYWDSSANVGQPYGDGFSLIIDTGARGGYWGGGMLTIISSNKIIIGGDIHLDGLGYDNNWWVGGGSGGGMLMISPAYEIRGMMTANGGKGGDGWDDNSGGGAGGRIKIFYNTGITTDEVLDNLSAKGGPRGGYLNTQPGEDGTIWIDAIPEQPVLIQPRDGAVFTDGRPTFKFTVKDNSVTTDHRDDDLSGIIELSTDNFKTIAKTYDQNESVEGWSDYSYKSGDIAEFTPPNPLPKGVRYQWRVFVKDRSIQSASSEIRSFTIKLTPVRVSPQL